MIAELENLARRLEQQLASFEKLHADELKRFEEQLAAYRRLQNDELQMLRDELTQLKDEIALLKAAEARRAEEAASSESASGPVELTVTRRDFLTGSMPPFNQRRA